MTINGETKDSQHIIEKQIIDEMLEKLPAFSGS
jgi:hypothetical protein